MAAKSFSIVPADEDGTSTSVRPLLVTVEQAGAILSLSRSSMYQLMWSEELVPIRIGRSVRFSIEQLERFVTERQPGDKE
ncbi:MAG: helix-turn-helix domain-containing protein [Ilumatobacter sp.]|uniref:helix-turn-helix domain-containing protein n=1 Tax=Ilumatobacter sp. TaxID=1967498 RepID=UPI00391902A6